MSRHSPRPLKSGSSHGPGEGTSYSVQQDFAGWENEGTIDPRFLNRDRGSVDSADGFGFTAYPSHHPDSHHGIYFPEFNSQAPAETHVTTAQGIETYTATFAETGLDAIAGLSLDLGIDNCNIDPSDTKEYYGAQLGSNSTSSEPQCSEIDTMADHLPQDGITSFVNSFSTDPYGSNMADPGPSNFYDSQAASNDTFQASDTLDFLHTDMPANTDDLYQYLDPSLAGEDHPPTDPEVDTEEDESDYIDPNMPMICDFVDPHSGKPCKNNKPFARVCDFRKHRKNHRKPNKCKFGSCKWRFAEKKELERHYMSCRYAETATATAARDKFKAKPCRCGYTGNGRADNIKRHRKSTGH